MQIAKITKCSWCGREIYAENGVDCARCWRLQAEIKSNPELVRKMLEHLTQREPDDGDSLAESELSNDELDTDFQLWSTM